MIEPLPEFSRIINPEHLSATGIEERLEAKPAECAALAKRFELIGMPSLVAELSVKPERRGAIVVTGTITADVVQRCVVTLEPLSVHLDLNIDMILVPESLLTTVAGSTEGDSSEDDLDYYADNKIDLGELVAQHLGINLDPYPRKPDAALEITEFGTKTDKPHPFAQLAELAKKPKNTDKTGH
jgi:uncharacterized metal-binding protein YceD (DUF177 family)